jgi:hypothetical protein
LFWQWGALSWVALPRLSGPSDSLPPLQKRNPQRIAAIHNSRRFNLPTISIDLSIIFSYASDIVNIMMPIVGVGAGISFGFSLVAYIIRLFRNIF